MSARDDLPSIDPGVAAHWWHRPPDGRLQPDTLQHIAHDSRCWLEITTLLIPGLNDSTPELEAMTRWIQANHGADVPLHFSAFHPDYKIGELPATPPATLARARRTARDQGLRHAYTGNVHDIEGDTTFCPGCAAPLIQRDGYRVLSCGLDARGACPHCGTAVAGCFAPGLDGGFGRRRVPICIASGPRAAG